MIINDVVLVVNVFHMLLFVSLLLSSLCTNTNRSIIASATTSTSRSTSRTTSSSSSSSSSSSGTQATIKCRTSYSIQDQFVELSNERINDNYCDCIDTGEDERMTNACSGSMVWPGSSSSSSSSNKNSNNNNNGFFTCPQQANLKLSYSKLNDGICDCCDGADENTNNNSNSNNNNIAGAVVECANNCNELLRIEKEMKQELYTKYAIGSKKRRRYIMEYEQLYEQIQQDIILQQEQLNQLQSNVSTMQSAIEKRKLQYIQQRIISMKQQLRNKNNNNQISSSSCSSFSLYNDILSLNVLNLNELQWFLIYTCQLAGEMDNDNANDDNNSSNNNNNNRNIKTCIPLRLAGLDYGITWEEKTYTLQKYDPTTNFLDNDESNNQKDDIIHLADMILFNNNNNNNNNENNNNNKNFVWTSKMLSTKNKKQNNSNNKNNNNRRRLTTTEVDDEEYDDPYEDNYHQGGDHDDEEDAEEEEEEEMDDDYHNHRRRNDHYHHRTPSYNNNNNNKNNNKSPTMDDINSETANKGELLAKIKSTQLASSRNLFITKGQEIIQLIETITSDTNKEEKKKDDDDDDRDEDEEEEDKKGKKTYQEEEEEEEEEKSNQEEEEEKNNKIEGTEKTDDDDNDIDGSDTVADESDPMKFNMIRNKIESKTKQIERGMNYAVSALVLIDAINDSLKDNYVEIKDILCQLIIGTIRHGQLSAVHIYQILQATLPEFPHLDDNDNDDQDNTTTRTCQSPWAGMCPPYSFERTITENNTDQIIQIPPKCIIDAVQKYCNEKLTEAIPSGPGFCTSPDSFAKSNNDNNDNTTDEDGSSKLRVSDLPDDIPDGYFGYTTIAKRSDDDILNSMLHDDAMNAIIQADAESSKIISEMEDELDRLENEKNNVVKKIKELRDSVGIDDKNEATNKFGPDGELHSIRDSCFEVRAGKYIYKVCMYKSAKQREESDNENGGTDLGRWKGASIEEVDDDDNDDDGTMTKRRIWKWENGAKCWNGPHRSATVYVTCGQEHKLLSAEEPDTCRYVLEMESPIGCDETFRKQHGLE